MTTKDTSQSQQKTASQGAQAAFPVDPSAAMSAGFDTWARWTREGVARMQALSEELAKLESASYERTRTATDELAQLVTDSLSYANQIGAEWRKLTLEATRRGADMITRS